MGTSFGSQSLRGVQENVALKNFSTFKIGGPARYFYHAETAEAMVAALEAAKQENIAVLVLGEGSNVLIADAGFDGLVILDRNQSFAFNGAAVACGSGLATMTLLKEAAAAGLGGMEFMAGIPGTVGAAVRGNAGAWGHGFSELLIDVELYRDGRRERVSPRLLQFAYRYSILRSEPWIVLSVRLKLTPSTHELIQFAVDKILRDRAARLPAEPSIGSIFKNIELKTTPVDIPRLLKALELTPDEYREHTKHGKLPVGFLSERMNLRGTKIGGAEISQKHGNIIINPTGTATADDVAQLIALVKTRIRNLLGIQLEEEIQYVGF